MERKKKLLVALIVAVAIGAFVGLGAVQGQILTEQTYYEEDYENVTHVDQSEYELEEHEEWVALGTRGTDYVGRYDPDGDRQWRSSLSNYGYAVTVMPNGNVLSGDRTSNVEMWHGTTGTRLWSDDHSNRVYAIESTANNTAYVANRYDHVIKYTADGERLWEADVDGASAIRDISVTPEGHAVVSGSNVIAKLDKDTGEEVWIEDINGPLQDIQGAVYATAITPDGTLYAAEYGQGESVFEMDSETGEILEEHEQTSDHDFQIRALELGPHGDLYAHTRYPSGVARFSQSMDLIWFNNDPTYATTIDSTITVTANGNVYVGTRNDNLRKYDRDTGERLWSDGGLDSSRFYGTDSYNSVRQAFDWPNYQDPPPVVSIEESGELDDTYSGEIYSPGWYTSLDEKSLSVSGEVNKQWDEPAIREDGIRNVYIIANIEAGSESVDAEIVQFGQAVGSGSVSADSREEMVIEFEPQTHELDVTLESDSPFEVIDFRLVTLEETEEGDPLAQASQPGGIILEPDDGYDQTIGMFVEALNITTDTLLYIVMIALIVGFMVFSYTKSVRGQELAQSMLFGAIIAGIVIVGLVPTMNLATWVFTGDVDRAPLANPALEAEPPTYYSTQFQAGTMEGWEFANDRTQGVARVQQVGDGFDLAFQGSGSDSGIVRHDKHISLGNALDSGFVEVGAVADGQSGLGSDGDPHTVQVNMRVYVTEDGNLEDSDLLSENVDYVNERDTEEVIENNDKLAAVEEVALSFDGEVVRDSQMAVFPLEGEHIHTRVVVHDNRGDVDPTGAISDVRVGATTEGGSVEH